MICIYFSLLVGSWCLFWGLGQYVLSSFMCIMVMISPVINFNYVVILQLHVTKDLRCKAYSRVS